MRAFWRNWTRPVGVMEAKIKCPNASCPSPPGTFLSRSGYGEVAREVCGLRHNYTVLTEAQMPFLHEVWKLNVTIDFNFFFWFNVLIQCHVFISWQDPSNIPLYVTTGTATINGVKVNKYRCFRGSNSLEGLHSHLVNCIPAKRCGIMSFQVSTLHSCSWLKQEDDLYQEI